MILFRFIMIILDSNSFHLHNATIFQTIMQWFRDLLSLTYPLKSIFLNSDYPLLDSDTKHLKNNQLSSDLFVLKGFLSSELG